MIEIAFVILCLFVSQACFYSHLKKYDGGEK